MNHFSDDDITPQKDIVCRSCGGTGEDVMLLRCTGCDGTGMSNLKRHPERKPGPSAIDMAVRVIELRLRKQKS